MASLQALQVCIGQGQAAKETCLIVLVPHHLEEVQSCAKLFILHNAIPSQLFFTAGSILLKASQSFVHVHAACKRA